MIRTAYHTGVTEVDLFSDEEFDDFVNTESIGTKSIVMGKRKLEEEKQKGDFQTIRGLESLDLDDDDEEDVLLLDTEEDMLLLDSGDADDVQKMPPPPPKSVSEKATLGAPMQSVEGAGNENDCHMKWLRTVGLSDSGALQCTVSNALETMSESGISGKTESLMADTIKGMIDVYTKKRSELIDSGGIVATPLHIVKQLAFEHGEELHSEMTEFPNGIHRVEIFSGRVRGIGEAVTKRIAAQMAAIDLLERVQLSGGAIRIPSVGFFPGWLTSNRVFGDLITLCKSKDLPRPRIICKPGIQDGDEPDLNTPPYHAECWVGSELVTIGKSEAEVFARREAAKEMYFLISNCEYKDTPYAIGKCCQPATALTAAGYRMPMSDTKKKWMLQHRVNNRTLEIPEEEVGYDNPVEVEELEKDLDNLENLGYKLMRKKTIKITVKNKKFKRDENEAPPQKAPAGNRRVTFKEVEQEEEDEW